MSQRARIKQMLEQAGPKGVRSDEFYKAFLPRAAARILELKAEGVPIETEREGKFVRYRIIGPNADSQVAPVGHVDGERDPGLCSADGASRLESVGVRSGEVASGERSTPEAPPVLFELDPPSAYDPFSEAA